MDGVVTGLDHVQIAIPRGGEDVARAFFGERLGLAEIAKPANLAKRGGVWFALGSQELHCGVEEPFSPARKAHPALIVQGLGALRARLEAEGLAPRDEEPLPGFDRFFLDDPFGNRLEFLERRSD
jgi:catechol 2,3-dioxygenase-like lactoylglutathione lyase family enzyme